MLYELTWSTGIHDAANWASVRSNLSGRSRSENPALYVEIKSIVRGDGAPADETSCRSRSET